MSRILLRIVSTAVFIGFVLSEPFRTEVEARTADRHVVVISIDGLGPEYYLEPERYGLSMPNLEALRDNGSYARGVVSQYPSLTYPSHVSMVTGTRPGMHGIVENTMFAPLTGSAAPYLLASAIRVQTIWDAAQAAGLTVGAVGWPVTVGASIDYLIPEIYPVPKGRSMLDVVREGSTRGLLEAATEEVGIDIVNRQSDPVERDRFNTAAAIYILRQYKPNLMLLHLSHTDSAQHDYGKHAPQVLNAFRSTDAHLGEILAVIEKIGIRATTTIVVTGDHGFYQIHSALQPNVVLRQAGLLQTKTDGKITQWKAATHGSFIRLADPKDVQTGKRVITLFRDLSERQYRGLFRIVDRKELDQLGAYPEALLAIEPLEGYTVTAGVVDNSFISPTETRGAHGYLPTIPAMHTGLVISGYGVKSGIQLPLVRQIDLAPTLAHLLGVTMKTAEGTALGELLEH